jgi:hypothetical protein
MKNTNQTIQPVVIFENTDPEIILPNEGKILVGEGKFLVGDPFAEKVTEKDLLKQYIETLNAIPAPTLQTKKLNDTLLVITKALSNFRTLISYSCAWNV